MSLGGMLGGMADKFGGMDTITAKLEELGIDASVIEGLDVDAVKTMIEEKGFDLSMLDNLGISLDDVIAKLKG